MAEEKIVKPVASQPSEPVAQDTPEPTVETDSKLKQVSQLSEVENTPKAVDVDTLIPSDPYYMDPLFYEVANYFGVEQGDYDGAKLKLADIVDYVIRDIKSNSPEKVLMRIRELEDSIEKPGWDEKRYSNLHKYIRLSAKKETIQQAMRAFEKGDKALNG